MSSIVQPNYGVRTSSPLTTACGTKQTGTQGSGFLDLAAKAGRSAADRLEISGGARGVTGLQTQEVSDKDAFEDFKKEIWNEIDSMPWGSSISVQITDDAFDKMMADEDFKKKMMNLIQEDASSSNTSCGGTIIRIDGNGYSGFSYMDDYADFGRAAVETHSKGKSAFYSKIVEKKTQGEWRLQYKRDMERTAKAAGERRDAGVRIAKEEALKKPFSSIADLLKARASAIPAAVPETAAGTDVPFPNL